MKKAQKRNTIIFIYKKGKKQEERGMEGGEGREEGADETKV